MSVPWISPVTMRHCFSQAATAVRKYDYKQNPPCPLRAEMATGIRMLALNGQRGNRHACTVNIALPEFSLTLWP